MSMIKICKQAIMESFIRAQPQPLFTPAHWMQGIAAELVAYLTQNQPLSRADAQDALVYFIRNMGVLQTAPQALLCLPWNLDESYRAGLCSGLTGDTSYNQHVGPYYSPLAFHFGYEVAQTWTQSMFLCMRAPDDVLEIRQEPQEECNESDESCDADDRLRSMEEEIQRLKAENDELREENDELRREQKRTALLQSVMKKPCNDGFRAVKWSIKTDDKLGLVR